MNPNVREQQEPARVCNQRFEMRRSLRFPVEVATSNWDRPLDLFASDLSPRGLFLESETMPDIGEQLLLSFNLWTGNRTFDLFGEVNRINWHRRKSDRGYPGFGVHFGSIRPMDRLRIRSAIRGLPPPLPSRKRRGAFDKYLTPSSRIPIATDNDRLIETTAGSDSRIKIYY